MLNCIQRNLIKTLPQRHLHRSVQLGVHGCLPEVLVVCNVSPGGTFSSPLLSHPSALHRPHTYTPPPHTHARTHTFVEACFLPVGVSAYNRYPAGAVLPTLRDAVLTRAVCSGARGIEGAALRTLSNESRRLTMHKPTWLANCSNIRRVLPSLLCDTEV